MLENISKSANVTETTKQQLTGEAFFLRALSYFYLTNIYGDVPLLPTTRVSVTSTIPRDSTPHIYNQIINDLLEAKAILSDTYPSPGKVRANKWAAAALLSRVYLYQEKWQFAESEATAIIDSGNYGPLDNVKDVFLKDSKESILQFWTKDGFTTEGTLFIPATGSIATYPVSQNLLSAFENDDQRRYFWIDSAIQGTDLYYYPFKYKNRSPVTGTNEEYLSILRLSEQYLIRAEARVEQDNISGAQADLNIVRNRGWINEHISNR